MGGGIYKNGARVLLPRVTHTAIPPRPHFGGDLSLSWPFMACPVHVGGMRLGAVAGSRRRCA